MIISGYLPLLLQSTALAAAGFPDLCPNVRQDAGLAHSLFPGDGVDSVYLLDSLPTTSCEGTSPCTAVNGTVYCPGLPSVVPDCRSADGAEQHRVSVSFGAFDMDPTAYASTFIGISVFFQALTFLSVSALGDFGDYRKRLLVITSTGGAVASLFCLAVVPDTWWLGGARRGQLPPCTNTRAHPPPPFPRRHPHHCQQRPIRSDVYFLQLLPPHPRRRAP